MTNGNLALLPASSLHMLCSLLYALTVVQTVHAYLSFVRRYRRVPVHEAMLALHLVGLLLFATAVLYRSDWLHVDFFPLELPAEVPLWIGAATACVDVPLALGYRMPYVLLDGTAMILTTPFALEAAGSQSAVLFFSCVAYFAFRAAVMAWLDHRDGLRHISILTLADAVRALPTGILYVDESGDAVFDNDAMRAALFELGIAPDLLDLSELPSLMPEGQDGDNSQLITLPSGRSLLFVHSGAELQGKPHTCYLAYDVSDLLEVEHDLASANEQLRDTQSELIEALANVSKVAENGAILRMRARVHDVVGQRLSIVHRALEDGNVSDETIRQLVPLVSDIERDLLGADKNAGEMLRSVVNACTLAGVEVDVRGELPPQEEIAKTMVDIVREATTNAVRHAHATKVDVTIAQNRDQTVLTVSNAIDGVETPLVEGTGIPGMRRAVEDIGGTLEVQRGSRFTIKVSIPSEGAHDARAHS